VQWVAGFHTPKWGNTVQFLKEAPKPPMIIHHHKLHNFLRRPVTDYSENGLTALYSINKLATDLCN
jgi:hypothetical protein